MEYNTCKHVHLQLRYCLESSKSVTLLCWCNVDTPVRAAFDFLNLTEPVLSALQVLRVSYTEATANNPAVNTQ